jgi:hypothetical protein
MENTTTEETKTDYFTYDDLLFNLRLLSRVENDTKLIIKHGNLDIDNRWIQSVRRFVTRDNREITCEVLKKIICSAEYHSNNLMNEINENENEDNEDNENKDNDKDRKLNDITLAIESSKIGLTNLTMTYKYDSSFISKINIYINSLDVIKHRNLHKKKVS